MNPDAAAAFGYCSHRVLGYRLEPLSAAHAAALDASGVSVFGDAIDPRDLVTFLRICSRPICPRSMRPRGWPEQCNGWRELGALAWLAIRGNLVSATKQVQLYLVDNLSGPEIRQRAGREGAQSVNGDAQFSRVTVAMRTGVSEYRAWSMSLGFLDWTVAQSVVNEGADLLIIDKVAKAAELAQLRKMKEAANG